MSGYSGTPLAKKLGIKAGAEVGVLAGPDDLSERLEPLPAGATVVQQPQHACDVLIVFAEDLSALQSGFRRAVGLLPRDGGLWLAWPKRRSGIAADLDFEAVQRVGLDSGLVDNKVCAIDETWSGLRFVVRREIRADWT